MLPRRARHAPPGMRAKLNDQGLVEGVRYVASPNCDERPEGCAIDLLVIHYISLPPGEFGGGEIEAFFMNRLDARAHPFFATIADLKASAHFLVRRDGEVIQFVPCAKRAWHAGESSWRGRLRCNDFSIGIEVEGDGALVRIEIEKESAAVRIRDTAREGAAPPRAVAGERLDLDHVGAEIRQELRAVGGGHAIAALDDANAGESALCFPLLTGAWGGVRIRCHGCHER